MQHTSTHIQKWKPVVGYEGFYEVSDHGSVRGLDRKVTDSRGRSKDVRGKVVTPRINEDGYELAGLSVAGVRKYHRVHRLVLGAFIGPCPDGMEVRHLNGDPIDNRLKNLKYGTRSENTFDQVAHGTHSMAFRKCCPRGHALIDPNLSASSKRQGARSCLACARAHAYAHKYNMMNRFEELAENRYAKIMAGAKQSL